MTAAVSLPPVTIRDMCDDDLGCVIAAWSRGMEKESYLAAFDKDAYFRLMQRHIKSLTREPGCIVRVACDPANESTILGFAVLTGDELHYVYVRLALWKHGIARLLLDGLVIKTYTFRTAIGERRIRPQERGWAYVPRVMRGGNGKFQVEMA